MESFKKMIPQEAIVLRNGQKITLNAIECVVGDIVFVKFGDRVPADIRIVDCKGLKASKYTLSMYISVWLLKSSKVVFYI